MKTNKALLPILAGFFVMSFCDIIGTVMNQVKAECGLSDVVAGFLPAMIFMWFFFISLPTGVLCGKIGRKNAVLVSMAIIGGAVVTPVLGFAQGSFGASGILVVLIACLAYLLALGLFANRCGGK